MTTLHKVIAGIVVVLLLALSAIGLTIKSGGTAKLGAQIQNEAFWFTNGVQFGNAGTNLNYLSLTMGTGKNQVFWQNNTGQTVYTSSVGARVIQTPGSSSTGLASTTFEVYIGTSTSATAITDKERPIYGSILGDVVIATSSIQFVHDGIANGVFSSTDEQGMVAIPNGQYIAILLENPYVQNCSGAICENATSTNRGFNLLISLPIWTQ